MGESNDCHENDQDCQIAAALLFGVAMASEASAGSRGAHHGGGYSGARVVKHGHAIGHRHAGYRARGVRAGLYAAAGFGVGYAAASGAYAGYGVTYAQPEATYAAAPVYAAPEPRSYVRSYQVPVTVNRVVTRQYQRPGDELPDRIPHRIRAGAPRLSAPGDGHADLSALGSRADHRISRGTRGGLRLLVGLLDPNRP